MTISVDVFKAISAERESADTPTPMALYGLMVLVLSPFAWLTNNIRMAMAGAGLLVYIALKPKVLAAHNSFPSLDLDKQRLREIYMWLSLLFLHAIVCTVVSAAVLLPNGEVTKSDFFDRSAAQLGSLLLAFLQIGCGFHLAKYTSTKTIRTIVYATFAISMMACIYQTIAIRYGLPYLGREVLDLRVGLRPSGLSGEPKGLAANLVIVLLFLLVDRPDRQQRGLIARVLRIVGIILGTNFFVGASSANGWIAVAITVAVYFLFLSDVRNSLIGALLGVLSVLVLLSLGKLSLSDVPIRESHEAILDNLSNLDLGLFDDLIALPMMAWLDNPLNVLMGFGPGLMHFFALRYLDQATWLVGDTYIDGNVSAVAYVSNFGLLLAVFLFVDLLRKARRAVDGATSPSKRAVQIFWLAAFVNGATVGGNVSVPFFLSVGWILASGTTVFRHAAPQ